MNDITALAQQLRATAEKANEHGEFNMAMHTVQVLALVEALEARDKQIAEMSTICAETTPSGWSASRCCRSI